MYTIVRNNIYKFNYVIRYYVSTLNQVSLGIILSFQRFVVIKFKIACLPRSIPANNLLFLHLSIMNGYGIRQNFRMRNLSNYSLYTLACNNTGNIRKLRDNKKTIHIQLLCTSNLETNLIFWNNKILNCSRLSRQKIKINTLATIQTLTEKINYILKVISRFGSKISIIAVTMIIIIIASNTNM